MANQTTAAGVWGSGLNEWMDSTGCGWNTGGFRMAGSGGRRAKCGVNSPVCGRVPSSITVMRAWPCVGSPLRPRSTTGSACSLPSEAVLPRRECFSPSRTPRGAIPGYASCGAYPGGLDGFRYPRRPPRSRVLFGLWQLIDSAQASVRALRAQPRFYRRVALVGAANASL